MAELNTAGGQPLPVSPAHLGVTQRRRDAESARRRAESARSGANTVLSHELARMHQYRVDAEISDTERSVRGLVVRGRTSYPQVYAFDPYFLAGASRATLLRSIVGTALLHSEADRAIVQLFDPVLDGLWIAAQHGFHRPLLEFFRWVGTPDGTNATPAGYVSTVAIPDVGASLSLSTADRDVMLAERVRAVQTTPMISTSGRLMGVLSLYYRNADPVMAGEWPLLGALADATAEYLHWHSARDPEADLSYPRPA
ncbi:hypothetical protein VMT65_17550 [Nocardia sp. CDC153]|uniref:hypothetical protein n=1 Tax=Nocardia sp. CDC153 TaxID=3112167 RepID=UPI002DBB4912|nr:hypothetical protein [Nocardia sp. CDC153]MEC3954849.1 hypothetical protein [Nocardia sp. CDC153]